ncbi:hypothetical protein N7G274_007431 [Stereocaulon virgatum]|uniref:Uncharacterized protein n=1 Tax=Stereocaulon virgatum TaxID=373712 RepID=A0ABR4A9I6_9LECA
MYRETVLNTCYRKTLNLSSTAWPEIPFTRQIRTTDPYDNCVLSVTNLGTRLGSATESYHVLLAISDRLAAFRDQPEASTVDEFDIVVVDILLAMRSQEDPTRELAIGALLVLDSLIWSNFARNIRSTIACNGVAYAKIKIDFLNDRPGAGNTSLSIKSQRHDGYMAPFAAED